MEALLYEPMENHKVQCSLCRHRCVIWPGKRGICGVRENQDGALKTLVYGKAIAKNADPIEKKPLFHVLPGSLSYSIATVGCNLSCAFCQNADIAQFPKHRKGRLAGADYPPKAVVEDALHAGSKTIAYTYTEPTVFFEYALEIAKLAEKKGLKNVFVSNGYMTPEAINIIGPVLTAANIDLKAMNDAFYKDLCGAKRKHVLDSLIRLKKAGVFLEVTTLVIPGKNDDPGELKDLASFLVNELGPGTPWHVSRFHPTYKLLDAPPTPPETLFKAHEIGKNAGLYYVYTGNIPGQGGEDTFCHNCGFTLIKRMGFYVEQNALKDGCCPNCGTRAFGVWK